jgi:hypothetical protein
MTALTALETSAGFSEDAIQTLSASFWLDQTTLYRRMPNQRPLCARSGHPRQGIY